MSDMLSDAVSYLADVLEENASSTISYSRGNDTPLEFKATYGRKEYELSGEFSLTRVTSMDFVFKAEYLNFGSGVVEPQRNDFITATIAGVEKTFQVTDMLGGQCFTVDSFGLMYRVHTKEVG